MSLFLERIRKLRKPERDLTAELSSVEKSVVTVITKTVFLETQLCAQQTFAVRTEKCQFPKHCFVFMNIRELTKLRNLNVPERTCARRDVDNPSLLPNWEQYC